MARLYLRPLKPAVSIPLEEGLAEREMLGAALLRIAKVGEEEDGLPIEAEYWHKRTIHIAVVRLLFSGSCDAFVKRALEQQGLKADEPEGQRTAHLLRGTLTRAVGVARDAVQSVLAVQRTAREEEERALARAGEERIAALRRLALPLARDPRSAAPAWARAICWRASAT